jgi:cell division protein FtsL
MPDVVRPDSTEVPHHHHKDRHLAERFEKLIGVAMVVAIAVLAIGLIYGVATTGGGATPTWMR